MCVGGWVFAPVLTLGQTSRYFAERQSRKKDAALLFQHGRFMENPLSTEKKSSSEESHTADNVVCRISGKLKKDEHVLTQRLIKYSRHDCHCINVIMCEWI